MIFLMNFFTHIDLSDIIYQRVPLREGLNSLWKPWMASLN